MNFWTGVMFWLDALRESMRASRAARELYSLSDRELNDLGISRFDIPRVIFETFDKQPQRIPSRSW
jgi:uncharacterized protein YjiS (DUF1127 family)